MRRNFRSPSDHDLVRLGLISKQGRLDDLSDLSKAIRQGAFAESLTMAGDPVDSFDTSGSTTSIAVNHIIEQWNDPLPQTWSAETFYKELDAEIETWYGETNIGNFQLLQNLERLNEFSLLQKGWNGYDADPPDGIVIHKARQLLWELLRYQPEVFPTARNSIQFEYEKIDGGYLEVEIFSDRYGVYGEIGDVPFVDEEYTDVVEVKEIIQRFNAE